MPPLEIRSRPWLGMILARSESFRTAKPRTWQTVLVHVLIRLTRTLSLTRENLIPPQPMGVLFWRTNWRTRSKIRSLLGLRINPSIHQMMRAKPKQTRSLRVFRLECQQQFKPLLLRQSRDSQPRNPYRRSYNHKLLWERVARVTLPQPMIPGQRRHFMI